MFSKMQFPLEDYAVNIQIWDRDLLSANDFISGFNIDIVGLSEKAYDNETRFALRDKEADEESQLKLTKACQ